MYLNKKILLIPLIFCITIGHVLAQQNSSLSWSLALQNSKTGEMVTFSAPVQSRTGEQFQLIIRPNSGCYCYVIAESSGSNDAAVLFAGRLKEGETWYSVTLVLSPPRGSELLYIVISQDEQKNLDQRIAAFNRNAGNSQRRALMNEVFSLRRYTSNFKEAPEKPILMGGAARDTSGRNRGVEYSGSGIYVKTISIEH